MSHGLTRLAVLVAAWLAAGSARAEDGPSPGPWAVEGAVALRAATHGEYADRLRDFGFSWVGQPPVQYDLSVVRAIVPAVHLLVDFGSLDGATYSRDILRERRTEHEVFSWTAHAAGAHLRLLTRFQEGRLGLYLQGGVGAAFGRTIYTQGLGDDGRATADTRRYAERSWARQWVWANGVQWTSRHGNGAYLEVRAITAVLFTNRLYDRHQSGGVRLLLGARWAP